MCVQVCPGVCAGVGGVRCVCMCAQVCGGVQVCAGACAGMFVPWHSHGDQKKAFHWLVFSFHLTLKQFPADSRLAGPQLLAGSPSFSSISLKEHRDGRCSPLCLALGEKVGSEDQTRLSGRCAWISDPLNHLPSPIR